MDMLEGTLLEGPVFTEGLVHVIVVAQLVWLVFMVGLLGASHHAHLFGTIVRCRSFRCPLTRREVEVEFVERWRLGVRCAATPASCSAFETPTAIECQRRCADRSFRNRWDYALPVPARWRA